MRLPSNCALPALGLFLVPLAFLAGPETRDQTLTFNLSPLIFLAGPETRV